MEIRNLTTQRFNTKKLLELGKAVLKKEGKRNNDLSLLLVGPQKMRELNKKHRGKDKPANVLAFSGGKAALGEIVLCPSVIKKDALEYKISFRKAFSWMFVHGLLHLLGYGHETKRKERIMTQKEQQYLSRIP